jgi:hypothetical protein
MMRTPLSAVCLALLAASLAAAQNTACTLAGTPVEQARCLLRPVLPYGKLGPERPLPAFLDEALSGKQRLPSPADLQRWQGRLRLTDAEMGGAAAAPIPKARYFVIHDTSSPYYGDDPLPSAQALASPEWKGNDLKMWEKVKVTHVFVTRRGESITARPFEETMRATKYERQDIPNRAGLFLHVENIQPRRRAPEGGPKNDAIAPTPGFSEPQLKRLAQLYLAASIRRGHWLIPAFHAAVDAGIPDAHDDPQNFDLSAWSECVRRELADLGKSAQPD